jgi:hypothetical protein
MNRTWKTGVKIQAMRLNGSAPFGCAGQRFGWGVTAGVGAGVAV